MKGSINERRKRQYAMMVRRLLPGQVYDKFDDPEPEFQVINTGDDLLLLRLQRVFGKPRYDLVNLKLQRQ